MVNISICMIVKNEADVLPRALANWQALGDELIIVDTGSSDNTVAIARAHDALVLHYEWQAPGHKGEARMVGINAAQGKWVVVLDADEVIDQPARLRKHLLSLKDEYDIVNVKFTNYDHAGQPELTWYQSRVFRRGRYHYIYREHEIPLPVKRYGGNMTILDVNFEHRPPSNRAAGKLSPMLKRLELDVEEHPQDHHPLYMLARQYGHCDQHRKAIDACERYMQMETANFKPDVCRVAGICADELGDRQLMLEWFYRGLAYEPMRRRLWVEIAQVYYNAHQYAPALELLRVASNLPLPVDQREVLPCEELAYICQLIEACRMGLASEHHHHH